MPNQLKLISLLAAALILGGCAASQSASTYTTGNVMQKMKVTHAVIVSIREVEIENKPSKVGEMAGGAAGVGGGVAVAGGGGGKEAIIGAAVGAVVGGITGYIIDRNANSRPGLEITYKLASGDEFVTVQEKTGSEDLKIGDKVRVIEGSFSTRVVKSS